MHFYYFPFRRGECALRWIANTFDKSHSLSIKTSDLAAAMVKNVLSGI